MASIGPSGGKIPDSSGPNHNKKTTGAAAGKTGGKSYRNVTENAQLGVQAQVAPPQPARVGQANRCNFSAIRNPAGEDAKKMADVAQTIFPRQ